MTSSIFNTTIFNTTDLQAFESLHEQSIVLTPEQIQQATQLSQLNQSSQESWNEYGDRLAQLGLMTWLADHDLAVAESSSTLKTTELQVRDFIVRSQFVSASEDEFVTVHRPPTPAHFYVLTTVAEEQGQIWVSGFLSHAELQEKLSDAATSEIPLSAFNPKMETLLLALRLTEPIALTESSPRNQVVNLRTWLSRQWEEARSVLDGWEPLGNSLGNSWVASALRGDDRTSGDPTNDHLPQILQSLARRGIRLANSTQGMSQILNIAPIPLRLYVVPGDVSETHEWELLVVLESATSEPMPSGLMLRIRDDFQVLLEQTFDPQTTSDRSLFAEIVSGQDESVFVDIVLPNGTVHTLPKFINQ